MTAIQGSNLHRTGQSWLTTWTPERVATAPDPYVAYAEYLQQVLGTPWSTAKDLATLRRKIHEVFAHYPNADFYTLCRLARWCRARNRRFSRVWQVIDRFRDAYVDRAFPELDTPPADANLDAGIADALARETDPAWRRRLLVSIGHQARREALEEWRSCRRSLGA